MIIFRKAYASEVGVGCMNKVKTPLNPEKYNATQSQIRKIIVRDQEVTDPDKMQIEIF